MTQAAPDPLPRRPVLAPGLRAVPVPDGTVQIGLGGRHRLRIADTEALRRVLDVLDRGEAVPDAPATRRVLRELAPVLRDGSALVHPRVPAGEVAATNLRSVDGPRRLARRSGQRVLVVGDLGVAPALDARTLVEQCGLGLAATPADASVALVLAHGEPDRLTLDPLLRAGLPHLVVRAVEGDVVIGPFVDPGTTACLRCVDAHEAELDRDRPMLLREYWRRRRHDGVAEPVDTATGVAALGFAAGDLVRFAERDEPVTWSATVTLTLGGRPAHPVPWRRHQRCGCSWISEEGGTARDRPSDTMGA